MPVKPEVRFVGIEKLECRDVGDGNTVRTISGYAAAFYKLSEDLGGFREKIAKGCFKSSVAKDDIRAFWSHDSSMVLGRTVNNTLRLMEDDYGLRFELDLPDTCAGRDAYTSIKRGDVTGMSFGFDVKRDMWDTNEGGDQPIRTLMEVNLFEVSPTAFPAYPQTQVSARALDGLEAFKSQLDAALKERAALNVAMKRAKFEAKMRARRGIK